MKADRKKNTARNMFWGMANRAVSLLFPFITRTIIIKTLGSDYVGLSSLFTSILQVLSLTELGFASAITFFLYQPIAEDDNKKVKALLTFFKVVYRWIGFIILAVALCLLPFLRNLIDGEITVDVNIYVLYILYLANSVISYLLFAYKGALIGAMQRNDIENKISTFVYTGMYIGQILILIFLKNYYFYYALAPISCLIINLIRPIVADHLYPEFKGKEKLSKNEMKEIWKKVRSLFAYKIGGIVSNSADNIIVSAFLGLSALAIFNNYYYIVAALFSVFTIYYDSMKASIGNSVVIESKEKNEEMFNALLLLQGWITGFCSICLLCLFQPFMKLWVGEELMLEIGCVVLFALYFFVLKMQDLVNVFKETLGLWEEDRFRPLIAAILNLGLNLATVKAWGIYGIIASTIISELAISLPWAPQILYKYYFKKSPKTYYLRLALYTLISIFAAGASYGICYFIEFDNSFLTLLLRLLVCLIVPNLIYFACFFKSKEFKKLLEWANNTLSKFFKKRN